MKVYETPNKEYRIIKQSNREWEVVFGEELFTYNICKYVPSLAGWNLKNPNAKLSDYVIIRSEEKIVDALKWLKNNNIISNDELKLQITKIGK